MGEHAEFRELAVDRAMALADVLGWEGVRMRLVADDMGVPPARLLDHFRDLDAIADAWFARGWRAMLAPPPPGFAALPAAERLHILVMRWFDALAGHRRVTRQMLAAKLYPSHPHHWVPLVFNLSRTVQWLRDAAMLDAPGRRRQIEEIALTALFLATLAVWAGDSSPGQRRTRDFLRRALDAGDGGAVRLWGRSPPPGQPG